MILDMEFVAEKIDHRHSFGDNDMSGVEFNECDETMEYNGHEVDDSSLNPGDGHFDDDQNMTNQSNSTGNKYNTPEINKKIIKAVNELLSKVNHNDYTFKQFVFVFLLF